MAKKYNIEFDLFFNSKKAKRYKFSIPAANHGQAFDKCKEIIESRVSHKIVSLEEDGEAKAPELPKVKDFDDILDRFSDPSNMNEDDLSNMIEMLNDFTAMVKSVRDFKRWDSH